ncbi:MAG TPA: hypothetical protein VFU15_11220 [Bacteroidia bacterium]|nr:hypothetical protein [Bacteroidia bacterium]
MDYKEIYTRLRTCWSDRTLRIPAPTFGEGAMQKVISCFFSDQTLVLASDEGPVKDDAAEKVLVKNATLQSTLLGVSQRRADAEFFADSKGDAHFILRIGANSTPVALENMFPSSAQTALGALRVQDIQIEVASQETHFTGELLRNRGFQQLISIPGDEQFLAPVTTAGARIKAGLPLPAGWEWIAEYLPQGMQQVSGVVEHVGGIHRFVLDTEKGKGYSFGKLNARFNFSLASVAVYVPDDVKEDSFLPVTVFRMGMTVSFVPEGGKEISVPCFTQWTESLPSEFRFEAHTSEIAEYAVEQFASLLGFDKFPELVPAGANFPPLTAVLLNRITAGVQWRKLQINTLAAEFGLNKDKSFDLIPGLIKVEKLSIVVTVMKPFTSSFSWNADANGIFSIAGTVVSGTMYGAISMPDFSFSFGLTPGSGIDPYSWFEKFMPLPRSFPRFGITALDVSGSWREKKFDFDSALAFDEGFDLLSVRLRETRLGFSYDGNAGGVAEKSISLSAVLEIGDKAEVFVGGSYYRNGSGSGFELQGEIVFNTPLRVLDFLPEEIKPDPELIAFDVKSVRAKIDTGKPMVEFELNLEKAMVAFPGFGRLSTSRLFIHIEKREGSKEYDWTISISGGLELLEYEDDDGVKSPLLQLTGDLVLKKDKNKTELYFEKKGDKPVLSNMPLLLPAEFDLEHNKIVWSAMNVDFKKIALAKKTKWEFRVEDVEIHFTRLPHILKDRIPGNKLSFNLFLGYDETTKSTGLRLELNKGLLDWEIPSLRFPKAFGLDGIELGKARLKITKATIVFSNRFGISVDVQYFLPTNLNVPLEKMGFKEMLQTYDPAQPDKSKHLGITIFGMIEGKSIRLGAKLSEVPISILEKVDEKWWAFHIGDKEEDGMGKFGCIHFEKPELSFDFAKFAFEASGAVKIVKDPAIPLVLIKMLFTEMKRPEIAALLPDKITLPLTKAPPLKDPQTGKYDVNLILKYLGLSPGQFPVVDDIIRRFIEVVNKLPKDFVDYLEPRLPEELAFRFKMTPDGSMEGSFYAKPGFRLLFIGPPGPQILGITLREISFGQMFGGQLLKLRVDAHIDSFDLLSLVLAASVTNTDWYTWMGTPFDFRRRFNLEKMLIFVIWQTQVPIPIPVFFKNFGVEYNGLFNVKAALGASFPEPEFNLLKLGELLKDLVDFARKPGDSLDENKTLEPFDLKVSLGPAYLQLGKKGSLLNIGSENPLDLPSAYQVLAKGLNTIKHFDLEKAIRSVPEKYRYARLPVTEILPGMKVEGMWMIATPSEFAGGNYALIEINRDRMLELMALLPKREDGSTVTEKDKGVVAFINGKWKTEYASVEALFSMVMIKAKHLAVQMRFKGHVSDAIYIFAGGLLKIAPPETPFQLEGKMESRLKLAGLDIYKGSLSIAISANRFNLLGNLGVMQENNLFYLKAENFGGAMGGDYFGLTGKISGKILFLEGGGEATLSLNGIDYWFMVADLKIGLHILKEGDALKIGGDIPIAGINFNSDSWIYPGQLRFRLKLTTADIGGLFSMEFEKETALRSGSIDVDFKLFILKTINNEPVLATSTSIQPHGVRVNGIFKLFHSSSPINLRGDISGEIGLTGFSFGGRVKVVPDLGVLPELIIVITSNSFFLSGKIGPVEFAGKIFAWRDDVVTCITWPGITSPWWIYFSAKHPIPVWEKHPGYDSVFAADGKRARAAKATSPLAALTTLALGFAAEKKFPKAKLSLAMDETHAWAAKRYDWTLKHESQAKGNSRITFTAKRITKGNLKDFFSEVLKSLPSKSPRPSLENASLELVFHTMNKKAGIKLTLRFPGAKLERHRKIVVKFTGDEKDDLKKVVKAIAGR